MSNITERIADMLDREFGYLREESEDVAAAVMKELELYPEVTGESPTSGWSTHHRWVTPWEQDYE